MPEIIMTIDVRIDDARSLDRFAQSVADCDMTLVGAVNPGMRGSPYRRISGRSSVLDAIRDATDGNKGISLYAHGDLVIDLESMRADLREQGLAYRIEETTDEGARTSIRWMPGFVGEIVGIPFDEEVLYRLEDVEALLRLAGGDFGLLRRDLDASERMTFRVEVSTELLPAPDAPAQTVKP